MSQGAERAQLIRLPIIVEDEDAVVHLVPLYHNISPDLQLYHLSK